MDKLQRLYATMAEHTRPECANCRNRYSCCNREYCDMATDYAASKGITLEPGDNEELPYMTSGGCSVPPWLRPLCTLHTCDVSSLGFKPGDARWTSVYFDLRSRIDELEYESLVSREGDNS